MTPDLRYIASSRAFLGQKVGMHCRWFAQNVVLYEDVWANVSSSAQYAVLGDKMNFSYIDGGVSIQAKAFLSNGEIRRYLSENWWDTNFRDFIAMTEPKLLDGVHPVEHRHAA